MTTKEPRSSGPHFKQFFVRGLVVLLPSVLTLWIVVKAYQFIDGAIAQPINGAIRQVLVLATPHLDLLREEFEPSEERVNEAYQSQLVLSRREPNINAIRVDLRSRQIREWWDETRWMDFIGLFVAILAVYIAGRLLGGFFGRRIYRKLEAIITSLPVFKQVYPYVKQIVDFLFSDDQPIEFNRVVAVEYPRKGIWSVGFMTGATMRTIAERSGDAVTVFIPSSPTPFTGYTITVQRKDMIELPISVEEAIRFAVSGGVLVPEHQLAETGNAEDLRRTTGLIPIPDLKQSPQIARGPETKKRPSGPADDRPGDRAPQ